jgi:hypothetical protein
MAVHFRPRLNARAAAALGLFERTGLAIEFVDTLHWRILRGNAVTGIHYLFWPATGYWKRSDGTKGAGGALKLIQEIRRSTGHDRHDLFL